MKKRMILFLPLIILFASLAIATDLTVETLPNHNVTIHVVDFSTREPISNLSFFENSDSNGIVSVSFSTTQAKVAFSIIIRENGKIIGAPQETVGYYTNTPILIDLKNIGQPEINETAEPEEVVNETDAEAVINQAPAEEVVPKTSLTGNVVDETANEPGFFLKILKSNTTYYIGGGILLVLVLGFVAFFILSRKKNYSELNTLKIAKAPVNKNDKEEKERFKDLLEVEKKMQAVQEEIGKIRNREIKVKEAEERYLQAKRDLERLRS